VLPKAQTSGSVSTRSAPCLRCKRTCYLAKQVKHGPHLGCNVSLRIWHAGAGSVLRGHAPLLQGHSCWHAGEARIAFCTPRMPFPFKPVDTRLLVNQYRLV